MYSLYKRSGVELLDFPARNRVSSHIVSDIYHRIKWDLPKQLKVAGSWHGQSPGTFYSERVACSAQSG